MQARFENFEAAKLDEETVSNASPQERINCVAEMDAYKSTNAEQHYNKGINQLFSKYLASRNFQSY
jgi:hypothetical protein